MAKKISKTVNRTGKSLVKKALVVKGKNEEKTVDAAKIKELNEKVLKDREKVNSDQLSVNSDKKEKRDEKKQDKIYELTVTLKDLLEAGSHLGHKISKTHPKARENIYTTKDGIEIVDLTKTYEALKKACNFIYNAQRNGKKIVLVGTKRQAREAVRRVAADAHVPYVTDRWLGGTISNWEQMKKSIKKLIDLKDGFEKNTFAENTKKEISQMKKESARLEKIVGGLTSVDKLFDIIFVVDAGFEKTAIKEAKLRNIKTVAMVDTDSNPNKVDFAIPANDDNVKSINLIVEEIGKAIKAAGVK